MLKYVNLETLNLGKIKNLIYSFGEKENLIESLGSNVISSDEIPGAIPAYISKEENEYKARYHIANEITLKEYFKGYIGREELTNIIENIANIVSKAQISNINLNNYLLNINNIYIDSDTKEIALVYIPLIQCNDEELVINKYIRELISNVKYNLNDDLNFFVALHNYLNEENVSINEIVAFMKSIKRKENSNIGRSEEDKNKLLWESNKSSVNKNDVLFKSNNIAINSNEIRVIEDAANIKIGESIENIEKPLAIHISTNSVNLENNNYYYENSNSIIDNEEKFGTTIIEDDDDFSPGTTILGDDDAFKDSYEDSDDDEGEGGTTLLGLEDDEDEEEVIPVLIRKSNNQVFILTKRKVRVGRDASSCDFVITNNKLVGRIHALIINDNGRYYIEDNNSTNGTFINGVKLPKMGKGKIDHGDEIKLANEIFTFR